MVKEFSQDFINKMKLHGRPTDSSFKNPFKKKEDKNEMHAQFLDAVSLFKTG